MKRSKVDRSLIRSYPDLRELIEEQEDYDLILQGEGGDGFSSLDDPNSLPPERDALDDPS